VRQSGLFTIHGSPQEGLTPTSQDCRALQTIEIPAKCKKALLSELSFYGVNSEALFPDLDGLAAFINWTIETKEYWRTPENPRPFG
jgi:hypothetical protein